MQYVYLTFVGYDYEGSQVDSSWSSQERANRRKDILQSQKYGDYAWVKCIPVDDLSLLQDNSPMISVHNYKFV